MGSSATRYHIRSEISDNLAGNAVEISALSILLLLL